MARSVDASLLGALGAAELDAWSLGAAAAADCRHGDLRALIGTSGTGAAAENGALTVAPAIAAQITADTAATYVADWSRLGVAIDADMAFTAKRDRKGDLEITCWLDLFPLLPSSPPAWAVA